MIGGSATAGGSAGPRPALRAFVRRVGGTDARPAVAERVLDANGAIERGGGPM